MTTYLDFSAGATALQRSAVSIFMHRLRHEWNGAAPVHVDHGRVWFAPIEDEI